MKSLFICLTALFFWSVASNLGTAETTFNQAGPPLYVNRGDNTTGFTLKYGNPSFTVDDNKLVGTEGGGWFALPIVVRGDFQIDFDVYGDSGDVDSYLILTDDNSKGGIMFRNCPEDTDDSSIAIHYIADLTDHDLFYFPHKPLIFATATNFPNKTWVHIMITKVGNMLTDNVGGQVISADASRQNLPAAIRIGLGYYSTTNLGGNGQIGYANIRIVAIKPR